MLKPCPNPDCKKMILHQMVGQEIKPYDSRGNAIDHCPKCGHPLTQKAQSTTFNIMDSGKCA